MRVLNIVDAGHGTDIDLFILTIPSLDAMANKTPLLKKPNQTNLLFALVEDCHIDFIHMLFDGIVKYYFQKSFPQSKTIGDNFECSDLQTSLWGKRRLDIEICLIRSLNLQV